MSDLQIGKFIARLRKEKGMTQKELADQLGLSDKAVSKWERGESYPEITLLPRLAEILEVSTDELLAGQRIADDAKESHSNEAGSEDQSWTPSVSVQEECFKNDQMIPIRDENTQHATIVGRRICSFVIDTIFGLLLFIAVFYLIVFLSSHSSVQNDDILSAEMQVGNMSMSFNFIFQLVNTLFLGFMGVSGFYTWLFLWITNGYTPGKWLLGLRVLKRDGSRMDLGTALTRDVILKGLGNLFTLNILSIASFIYMLAGKEKQTLHDKGAETDVKYVRQRRGAKSKFSAGRP